jgi:nucleotide-binding universal stress UspA family protein
MELKRILVTVDFSKYDQPAVEMATSLARDCGASLLILHVHESPMAYGGAVYEGDLNPSEQRLRQMLAAIAPEDTAINYEHRFIYAEGTATLADTDIARAICRFADDENADLIVVSTHGRSGLRRTLMGSVAEKIVARATRPVLTVKLPSQPA